MKRNWYHIEKNIPISSSDTLSVAEFDEEGKPIHILAKTWELEDGSWAWIISSNLVSTEEEFTGTENTREEATIEIARRILQ